jgi:tRNA (uracil-5-)-methyltransferase TRM9
MKHETRRQLNAINQAFYAAVADEFSDTRSGAWTGWERALRSLSLPAEKELAVLDVGCGNGRFARFLDATLAERFRYLGVDSCPRLLDLARDEAPSNSEILFQSLDVLGDEDRLPRGPFDLIAVFGLLHHVPGFDARRALLDRCASRLAPGGAIIVTAWRFGAFDRFRTRFIDWQAFNAGVSDPAGVIDVDDLEPGDHLLGWRDAPTPRYCHFVDRSELDDLVAALDLRIATRFDADGKTGDLNEYAILRQGRE